MLLKNITEQAFDIQLETRLLHFDAGDEHLITSAEVLDENLRDYLQMRTVAVVRPATLEEEHALLGRNPKKLVEEKKRILPDKIA